MIFFKTCLHIAIKNKILRTIQQYSLIVVRKVLPVITIMFRHCIFYILVRLNRIISSTAVVPFICLNRGRKKLYIACKSITTSDVISLFRIFGWDIIESCLSTLKKKTFDRLWFPLQISTAVLSTFTLHAESVWYLMTFNRKLEYIS